MKLSDLYPSKYLKATDLQGEEPTARIREVKTEELGTGKDHKPVVYFHGTDKGLVLNKTNAMTIGDCYGDDTEQWRDKPIILYSAWVDFQGRSTQAIRVRVPAQQPQEQKVAPMAAMRAPIANYDDLDDGIPF